MVHPFNPREPTTVEDSWIVSVAKGSEMKILVNQIEWLIGGSHLEDKVKIASADEKTGLLCLKCDGDFIEKVSYLPAAGSVEAERRAFNMNKGGPKP